VKFSIDATRLLLSTSEPQALRLDARPFSAIGTAPPKEVKLLSIGLNRTVYGDLWVTEDGMRQALALEANMGRDLCWDWNHWTEPSGPTPPNKEATEAAAWFSLAARPDGLWAVKPKILSAAHPEIDGIHWTPKGAQDVLSGGFRHFSPGVLFVEDRQTKIKTIVGVTSSALTNNPATLGQKPLLCAAPTTGSIMNWADIERQMRANGATDAQIATAKADFDGGRVAEALQLSATIASERVTALGQQAETNARAACLSEFSTRFTPAERATLEGLPAATLRALLSVRPVLNIHAPAVVPTPQPVQQQNLSAQQVITGGDNPISWNNRPWEQLNYKERHALCLGNNDLYGQMRRQAVARGLRLGRVANASDFDRPVVNIAKLLSAARESGLIEQLRARRVLLATGTTGSADIVEIIPEILNDALEAGFPGMRVFGGSPVCMTRGTLPRFGTDNRLIKGGSKVIVPYFESIGAMEKVTDEKAPPSTNQTLETTKEEATVEHWRIAVQITYEAIQFAMEGSDPYNEASRQMLEQARNQMEDLLIVEARSTALALDITGVGDGLLTDSGFNKALALWGDEEFEEGAMSGGMIFLHSNSVRQVREIKDSTGRPIFTEPQNGGAPIIKGMKSKVSDRLAVVSSNHVLTIAKAGALACWFNQERFRVQTFHDVSTDQDLNVVHLYVAPHLYKRPPRRTKCAAVKLTHKALA
jgi:hypothetical protein